MNAFRIAALTTFLATLQMSALAKEHTMIPNTSIAHAASAIQHAAEMAVYHVDSYLATRTPIARSALETYPDVEVHVTKDRATIEKAYAEFHASQPTRATAPKEYRWKLVFSDASQKRLIEIYVAAFAHNGSIGDTPVQFGNDALVKWLRATYAPREEHVPTP
jgi:hypothetical protein